MDETKLSASLSFQQFMLEILFTNFMAGMPEDVRVKFEDDLMNRIRFKSSSGTEDGLEWQCAMIQLGERFFSNVKGRLSHGK